MMRMTTKEIKAESHYSHPITCLDILPVQGDANGGCIEKEKLYEYVIFYNIIPPIFSLMSW